MSRLGLPAADREMAATDEALIAKACEVANSLIANGMQRCTDELASELFDLLSDPFFL